MKIKGIPPSETIWVIQKTKNGDTYYITAKDRRDMYYIYKEEHGEAIKLNKGKNPARLLDQYTQ